MRRRFETTWWQLKNENVARFLWNSQSIVLLLDGTVLVLSGKIVMSETTIPPKICSGGKILEWCVSSHPHAQVYSCPLAARTAPIWFPSSSDEIIVALHLSCFRSCVWTIRETSTRLYKKNSEKVSWLEDGLGVEGGCKREKPRYETTTVDDDGAGRLMWDESAQQAEQTVNNMEKMRTFRAKVGLRSRSSSSCDRLLQLPQRRCPERVSSEIMREDGKSIQWP